MSWQEELSPEFVNKFPELPAIEEALEADREGREVTAVCYKCGQLLTVAKVPDISVWVTCGNGCTRFRMSYSSKP